MNFDLTLSTELSLILFRASEHDPALARLVTEKLGWDEVFEGKIPMEWVPGDHFSMLNPRNASVLALRYAEFLQQQCKYSVNP